ncbi:MAG TPA: hypothetical protein VK988_21295 [Acidimicrobiales bacterium]|nr:hypothetical protein [Acidimicrobiales bacterium]
MTRLLSVLIGDRAVVRAQNPVRLDTGSDARPDGASGGDAGGAEDNRSDLSGEPGGQRAHLGDPIEVAMGRRLSSARRPSASSMAPMNTISSTGLVADVVETIGAVLVAGPDDPSSVSATEPRSPPVRDSTSWR